MLTTLQQNMKPTTGKASDELTEAFYSNSGRGKRRGGGINKTVKVRRKEQLSLQNPALIYLLNETKHMQSKQFGAKTSPSQDMQEV